MDKDEIHVWTVPLDVNDSSRDVFESFLSADERARAGRYRFEIHRRHLTCGRGALRVLLGEYLGCDPETVEFRNARKGKPYLLNPPYHLSFNLAHSDDMALIAVGRDVDIGIDLEAVRWMPDFDELV